MVEPIRSSRVTVPAFAAWARRFTSAAQPHKSRASACRTTGTIRPAGVCAAMPTCTPAC